MQSRIARIVPSIINRTLPGTPEQQDMIRRISRARFPNDQGKPEIRLLFDWLLVIDQWETFSELRQGFNKFSGEMHDATGSTWWASRRSPPPATSS